MKLLANEGVGQLPAIIRQDALLAIGRFGNHEHIALVEPLLKDTDPCSPHSKATAANRKFATSRWPFSSISPGRNSRIMVWNTSRRIRSRSFSLERSPLPIR